jgi:hypothetical protein
MRNANSDGRITPVSRRCTTNQGDARDRVGYAGAAMVKRPFARRPAMSPGYYEWQLNNPIRKNVQHPHYLLNDGRAYPEDLLALATDH